MTFYGIEYLQVQSGINDYLKYIVIFSALSLLIIFFILYMHHRLQTKYRDLTIIVFLFLIFISGVQYEDYSNSQNLHSASSQMVSFVKQLAKENNVNENDVFSSSIQLTDGVVVKIKDNYYVVNLSPDQNTYRLVSVGLINPKITIKK
ncbi:DUF3290 domain-containing protein [Tatumella sp. JGM118]|uniref:DUF3290 domain-containing protein n=1 Tax=Tatumella terrea TaxID=419007 RepID=A0ABW1VXA4_9GAMM|nr:DUF3290 domain-containing protein [Tatumella sp. JGM118]MBS0910645.1 DUF3290 domain-containing protein [Tatumella sp. JGM118]